MRMNTKKAKSKKVTGKVKEGQIQICHGKKFSMKMLTGQFLQYFPKNYYKTPIFLLFYDGKRHHDNVETETSKTLKYNDLSMILFNFDDR